MKKLSIFLSVFLLVLIKAQNLSDYKYVLIPAEFNDFKENRSYGLGKFLERSLKSKKYIVLSETKSQWPQDALLNPCKIVNADILDDKSMFRNKIILQFKDCNSKVIYSEKSSSTIKEFEPGYQDALKQGLVKVTVSNPSPEIEKLAESKTTDEVKRNDDVKTTQTPIAQRYKNGNLSLQKIQIDDSQFILVDGNSSVPFATFKATNKSDVFRVKLASGESTIGYFENGNIVIEIPKSNGDYAKEVFSAN
ncbi:hypothetical protein [Epilithonimonas sp.]|uniref:hypothetical protein n=1 Tax=Epilithonimonas sp. TaxID=2894511 RepID=UPI0028A1DEEA|nr:hypothetical protein [Epilithonimonas sp.]